MKKRRENDAKIRIVLAVLLIIIDAILNYGLVLKLVLAVLAILLVVTGTTKTCGAYSILGIKT